MALKPCKECRKEVSSGAKTCPHCGVAWPTGKPTSPAAIGCLAIIGLGALAAIFGGDSSGGGSALSGPPPKTAKDSVRDSLSLSYTWEKGGFESVLLARFTVDNRSNHAVKDLRIVCEHFAASGTNIDSNRETVYQTFPAKKKTRTGEVNMGFIHSQVEKSGCVIDDFALAD
jgi:hypothetical protein